jgi:hypothetical protein
MPKDRKIISQTGLATVDRFDIEPGKINQRGEFVDMFSSNSDKDLEFHHSFATVPYTNGKGLGEGPYSPQASNTTKCIATVEDNSSSGYKWLLQITNTFFLNGAGGSSTVAPIYRTIVNLPEPGKGRSGWRLFFKLSSLASDFNDLDALKRQAQVELQGGALDTTFPATTTGANLSTNFKVDGAPAGTYTLTLEMSKVGLLGRGDRTASLETELSVEIAAEGKK